MTLQRKKNARLVTDGDLLLDRDGDEFGARPAERSWTLRFLVGNDGETIAALEESPSGFRALHLDGSRMTLVPLLKKANRDERTKPRLYDSAVFRALILDLERVYEVEPEETCLGIHIANSELGELARGGVVRLTATTGGQVLVDGNYFQAETAEWLADGTTHIVGNTRKVHGKPTSVRVHLILPPDANRRHTAAIIVGP